MANADYTALKYHIKEADKHYPSLLKDIKKLKSDLIKVKKAKESLDKKDKSLNDKLAKKQDKVNFYEFITSNAPVSLKAKAYLDYKAKELERKNNAHPSSNAVCFNTQLQR